ncbi:ABC transporter substrate-binding protein [Tropicimonas sp. TH_r6]|uniref:ABC transporter substrate-binding protein n=1 Tax=Tropicimonas sp. TH_r6 TaxID=3082085 RepID=UPI002953E81F|nr:ABC transporter substrate-binding protein [Tropicimonas sp. TH_r6]MDV7143858.1 ABC transporter substrate-binding protein [Tropicimonas sp. TH_r6]
MLTRRHFLNTGSALLASPAFLRATRASAQGALPITVSSYLLDRTEALFDGRVEIEGTQATFVADAIGDMNTAAFSGNGTREITELGLHPFMLAHANEGFRDYALLPIPLLRQFRHKSVFVHADAGIETPQDLRGRRIGTPGYSSTSLTWIRGIFEDEYGLKPSEVEWVQSVVDSSSAVAGAASAQEMRLPDGIRVTNGTPGLDESELLLEGEVDALFHAATPAAFIKGDARIKRLFPDFRSVERDYFERTGIFPIMHVLAIRRDVAEDHPWLARAVFDAYSQAKTIAYETKDRLTWATDMLPWYSQELEDTRALMGRNFYPYGIAPNRTTIEMLFRYSHSQGLASRVLDIDETFLPGSLELAESI